MLIYYIFFIIIIIININKKSNIENFRDYKYLTFEINKVYQVGNTIETIDLQYLLKNKLKLKSKIYNNSEEILNDVNSNKLDFGIVYDNFLQKKYSNIKKISYINYTSHLLLTYDNSIKNIFDLQNKKVCFGLKNSNSFIIGRKIFDLLNIKNNIITYDSLEQLILDFNNQKINVLYINSFAPNSIINKLNLDNLYFIDITNNIDRNILYRINLIKNKKDKFLIYKNYTTINNPSNNIWLVTNIKTNEKIISNIINNILNLKYFNIKIGNNFLSFKNIFDIIIDDNEAKYRNLIKNEKLFKSFTYNTNVDYHNLVIQKYYDLGYITDNKNLKCLFHYKHSRC